MEKKRGNNTYNKEYGYLKTLFTDENEFVINYKDYKIEGNNLIFAVTTNQNNSASVVCSFINDKIINVKILTDSKIFNNQVILVPSCSMEIEETEGTVIASKGNLLLKVNKEPWCLSIAYKGRDIFKEQISDTNVDNMCKYLPVGFKNEAGKITKVRETFEIHSDESYYGFGEKFQEFNKRNQLIHICQSDALATNTEKSYKNHPFFISSRGYGLFVNSYTTMNFDMGYSSNVSAQIEIDDNNLEYFVIAGNNDKEILTTYLNLFGSVPQIPNWAFGLWMSKCSYLSRDEIESVIAEAKKREIQIDVIHVDNWQHPDYVGLWKWNEKTFPNPKEMIEKLNKEGVHLSLWIYPYLSELSPAFKEIESKGYFVKDNTGKAILFSPMATVSYKVACFDFTNPEFIAWYKPIIKEVMDMGVSVIKTDFSEAVPLDAVYYDGSNGKQGHNKLTYLYAKTIYDTLSQVCKEKGTIPMIWCRSGYSGSHMIPAVWAGDSSSTLANHACLLKGGLSAAESGMPYWGFDLGGFYNTDEEGYECLPSEEEYIRSFEFGLLAPLSRFHGKTNREPWTFSEKVFEVFKKYYKLRKVLYPYLCSEGIKTAKTSIPMMRPLRMEFEDLNVKDLGSEYMLGGSLLVAPKFDQDPFNYYLPEGTWKNFFNFETKAGCKWYSETVKIEDIPLFIKENSVIPITIEGELALLVYSVCDFETVIYYEGKDYNVSVKDKEIKTSLPFKWFKLI